VGAPADAGCAVGGAADARVERAYDEAARIADEDVAACAAIGRHGRALLAAIHERAAVSRCAC